MTLSELKYHVGQTNPYFFTPKTLRFFGDTMQNYGVRETIIINYLEETVEVWELYRKRPVKHGLQASAYFRKDTFERCYSHYYINS